MRSVRAGIHDLVGGLDGAAQEDCAQGEGHDLRDGEGPPHQLQPSGPGQQPRHRQQYHHLTAHGDDQAVHRIADGLEHGAGDDAEACQQEGDV